MAVTYYAARAISIGGTAYNAGDTVSTVGWTTALISEYVRLGWLAEDNPTGLGVTFQPLNLEGVLASRPAANSVSAKTVYFATDDNGGSLYRSDGTSWVQMSPGVTATPGSADLAKVGIQANFDTTTVFTSTTDVTGLTGCSCTVPASGNIRVCFDAIITNTASTNKPIFQVIDESAVVIMSVAVPIAAANDQQQRHMERKITGLTSGATKTYKVVLAVTTSGTARIIANASDEAALWIRAA